MPSDAEIVVRIVAGIFNDQDIPYLLGGSVASSILGIPRFTLDVDFVAEIRLPQVPALQTAFLDGFYADASMMEEAIRRESSFNVIHLETMYKAVIFIRATTPWAVSEWERRRPARLGEGVYAADVLVASPEDVVLHKLTWFRMGGGVSDRQWSDVLGVLKVQANALDRGYLTRWANELGLSDLLHQAMEDAGGTP